MVGYSKDFGYGLLGNNVVGGVVSYADQIFGDMMIMNDIPYILFSGLPRMFRVYTGTAIASIPAQGSMRENTAFHQTDQFKSVNTSTYMKSCNSDERKRNEM